jgi:energy-coupling factor transport system substrate-specific component
MSKYIKYIISFVLVLVFRLLPFRAPNIEPVMAVASPLGKKLGGFAGFIFGFLSIVIYDFLTTKVGIWTIITAFAYGAVGFGAYYFMKNKTGWKNYATYAFFSTIIYDAITGLTIGPLFFNQSFAVSLVGQIPFTALHLLGNVSFAIILSPAIEYWFKKSGVVEKEKKVAGVFVS